MSIAAKIQGLAVGVKEWTFLSSGSVDKPWQRLGRRPSTMVQPVTHHQIRGDVLAFHRLGKNQRVPISTQGRLALPSRGVGCAKVFAQRPFLCSLVPVAFKQVARPFPPSWAVAIPWCRTCREYHGFAVSRQRGRPFILGRVHTAKRHRRAPLLLFRRPTTRIEILSTLA